MRTIIDVEGEAMEVEFVHRLTSRPLQYPVCTWDGASGTNVARTLDGSRWFACDYSGYFGPSNWHAIQTPSVQPPL